MTVDDQHCGRVQNGPAQEWCCACKGISCSTCSVACCCRMSCCRPAGAGVLLQGLHLTGCKGSAVVVSGALGAPQGVQWASLPAGLHLVNTTLAGNAAAVGGGLRASRAAVYLESVQVSGNQADQLGGGVSVDGGLLVAFNTHFTDNTAGTNGQM